MGEGLGTEVCYGNARGKLALLGYPHICRCYKTANLLQLFHATHHLLPMLLLLLKYRLLILRLRMLLLLILPWPLVRLLLLLLLLSLRGTLPSSSNPLPTQTAARACLR